MSASSEQQQYQVGDLSKLFGSSETLQAKPQKKKKNDNDEFFSNLKKEGSSVDEANDDKPKERSKKKSDKKEVAKKEKKEDKPQRVRPKKKEQRNEKKNDKKKPSDAKKKNEKTEKKTRKEKRKRNEKEEEETNEEKEVDQKDQEEESKQNKYEAKEGEVNLDEVEQDEDENEDKDDVTKPQPKRKKQKKVEKQSENTVFVSNFPIPMDDKNLKKSRKLAEKLFSIYGTIESIRFRSLAFEKSKIPTRKGNLIGGTRTKECGNVYVHFDELKVPIEQIVSDLNGKELNGRHLNVDLAHNGQPTKEEKERSVFIENLPYDIDDEDVWTTIGSEYDIHRVRLIRDKISGQCKGFGYVQFKDKETVQAILKGLKQSQKHVIRGRKMEISKCKQ